MRYLKHKVNGTVFEWNERLGAHRSLEEVTEEQAYPELPPNPELEAAATRRLKVAL